ncbi:MAG: ABC transporter permease [Thermomicrobiales bacterium]|nr:ABC transporter permease [Thermomicrobiales bacterium]MCO5221790.1 ABC transporter permease [Thermomicrobiales bacterium]
MTSFLSMITAFLKMTVRNRTALFWNLIFPVIFILVFGTVFNETDFSANVGIAGAQSDFHSAVVQAMDESEIFDISTNETVDQQLAQLQDGDRDAVLVFGDAPAGGGFPTVQLYYDEASGPNSQVSISAIQQTLNSVAQGPSPVTVETQPVQTLDISYMDFLLPGILAMSVMNSGVIGLSTSFVTFRERGILRRIKITPFPLASFITARVISQLIIAVPQALILYLISHFLFGVDIQGSVLLVILAIFIGSIAFLAIGFAISSIAPNVETAASYSNLITFPMLFLSGVFFDIDSAPAWLQPITRVLPLRFLVDALREVMTRGKGLDTIWLDLVVLLATALVAVLIAVRFFRWDARSV